MSKFQLAVKGAEALQKPTITFHINPDVSDGEVDVIAEVNGERFLVLSLLENEEGKIGFKTYSLYENEEKYFAAAPNGKLAYVR